MTLRFQAAHRFFAVRGASIHTVSCKVLTSSRRRRRSSPTSSTFESASNPSASLVRLDLWRSPWPLKLLTAQATGKLHHFFQGRVPLFDGELVGVTKSGPPASTATGQACLDFRQVGRVLQGCDGFFQVIPALLGQFRVGRQRGFGKGRYDVQKGFCQSPCARFSVFRLVRVVLRSEIISALSYRC